METHRLECFVAVARELHFGRAAASIPMAQSALSRQIKLLESEVGVALFTRTTRRVALTPAGAVFVEHAERIIDAVNEAIRTAVLTDAGQEGHIRVGFGGSATYGLMPDLARAFRTEHPGVRLELHSEMVTRRQTEALLSHHIDVGLLRPPVAVRGLTIELLRREHLVLAMPTGHALAATEPVALADLADTDFVTYPAATGASIHPMVISACNAAGFTPRVAQEASETHTVVGLVAAGIGVALVPDPVRHLTLPGVVYRGIAGDPLEIDLSIATRNDEERPAVLRFVALAHQVAGGGVRGSASRLAQP